MPPYLGACSSVMVSCVEGLAWMYDAVTRHCGAFSGTTAFGEVVRDAIGMERALSFMSGAEPMRMRSLGISDGGPPAPR
jgi:hypothetical protein